MSDAERFARMLRGMSSDELTCFALSLGRLGEIELPLDQATLAADLEAEHEKPQAEPAPLDFDPRKSAL